MTMGLFHSVHFSSQATERTSDCSAHSLDENIEAQRRQNPDQTPPPPIPARFFQSWWDSHPGLLGPLLLATKPAPAHNTVWVQETGGMIRNAGEQPWLVWLSGLSAGF